MKNRIRLAIESKQIENKDRKRIVTKKSFMQILKEKNRAWELKRDKEQEIPYVPKRENKRGREYTISKIVDELNDLAKLTSIHQPKKIDKRTKEYKESQRQRQQIEPIESQIESPKQKQEQEQEKEVKISRGLRLAFEEIKSLNSESDFSRLMRGK